MHTSQNLACTLCSSTLEQARNKFDTALESLQIGEEYPAIKHLKMCMHARTQVKT